MLAHRFALTGGTLELRPAEGTVAVVSTDSSVSASFNSVITDGSALARLAKTGPGTLVLSGTNTYSSGTRIDGGTL